MMNPQKNRLLRKIAAKMFPAFEMFVFHYPKVTKSIFRSLQSWMINIVDQCGGKWFFVSPKISKKCVF